MKINKLILILMIGSISIANTTIPKMSWPLFKYIGYAGMITGSYVMGHAARLEELRDQLSDNSIISLKYHDRVILLDWLDSLGKKEFSSFGVTFKEFGSGLMVFVLGFYCYYYHKIALYEEHVQALKEIHKLSKKQKEA